MGSCISKCKPKTKLPHLPLNLVISQPPIPLPSPPLSLSNNIISPFPPSPSPSSSSLSSFTCVSSNTSLSSLSTATSGQRFFSDDFLWSCYRHNPHLRRINSLKATNLPSPAKVLRLNSVSPQTSRSIPQKRVRSASPTPPAASLTRQKIFKKNPSPFPSRRLSVEKRVRNDSKPMVVGSVSLSSRKGIRGRARACANSNRSAIGMNKETCVHRISSKIDETAVGDALSNHDSDSVVPMEDIDNPLISLDCFIFI